MTLTAQRPAPAPQTMPYAPQWMLHLYDRAFLTFDGKIVAVAPCSTPDEEDRLIALLDRLIIRSARRYR